MVYPYRSALVPSGEDWDIRHLVPCFGKADWRYARLLCRLLMAYSVLYATLSSLRERAHSGDFQPQPKGYRGTNIHAVTAWRRSNTTLDRQEKLQRRRIQKWAGHV